jgi:hypothetical protein
MSFAGRAMRVERRNLAVLCVRSRDCIRVGRPIQNVVNHRDMRIAAGTLRVCNAAVGEGQ